MPYQPRGRHDRDGGYTCAECGSEHWDDGFTISSYGPLCPTCVENVGVEVVDMQTRRRYRDQPAFDTGAAA